MEQAIDDVVGTAHDLRMKMQTFEGKEQQLQQQKEGFLRNPWNNFKC